MLLHIYTYRLVGSLESFGDKVCCDVCSFYVILITNLASLALLKELYSAGAHHQAGTGAPFISVLYGNDSSRIIARNVGLTYDDSGRLASSLFFLRGNKNRKARLLFPTIARDLADLDGRCSWRIHASASVHQAVQTSPPRSHHAVFVR